MLRTTAVKCTFFCAYFLSAYLLLGCATVAKLVSEPKLTSRSVAKQGAPSPRWNPLAHNTSQQLLLWGGCSKKCSSDEIGLADGAILNTESNTWIPAATKGAPSPRQGALIVWSAPRLYVWGGCAGDCDNGRYLNNGAVFDVSTNKWSPLSPTNAPTNINATGNRLRKFTVKTNKSLQLLFDDTYVLDFGKGQWQIASRKAPPVKISTAQRFDSGDKVYFLAEKSSHAYDAKTFKWEEEPSFRDGDPMQFEKHTSTSQGLFFYGKTSPISGQEAVLDSWRTGDAALYDTQEKTWKKYGESAEGPTPRAGYLLRSYRDKVFVFGYQDFQGDQKIYDAYFDLDSRRWKKADEAVRVDSGPQFIVNGHLVKFGEEGGVLNLESFSWSQRGDETLFDIERFTDKTVELVGTSLVLWDPQKLEGEILELPVPKASPAQPASPVKTRTKPN